jgi:hypothetical protein
MSTSATFAAISASQASLAAAAAHQAKVERCKAEIATFDSKTATIAQSQGYADCVRTVYPQELTGASLTAAKIVFVFALLCGIYGAYRSTKEGWHNWVDHTMFGALWFILGPIAAGCVLGILYGIYWVIA